MDIKVDDFLKLMSDIYIKVQSAENMIKDGKLWIGVNKLIGLRQKLEQVAQRVKTTETDENNTDNTDTENSRG